jgi:hypothetical protein
MASPARKAAPYVDLIRLPDERVGAIVEVLWRESASWVLAATHVDDAIVRAEPFDAIELDLLHLWGEERSAQAG